MCALSDGSVFGTRYSALGVDSVPGIGSQVLGTRSPGSGLGIRPSAVEGWGKGDGTFPHPSSTPGAENRRPDPEFGARYPVPGTGYLEECRAHASKNVHTGWA